MEKRLILAIVLSFLVLIGYQLLFVKPKPQIAETPAAAPPTVSGTVAAPPGQAASPAATPARSTPQPGPAPDLKATAARPETEVAVETSLYRAVWTSKGGLLKSWKLKKHLDDKKEPLDLVPAQSLESGRLPFALRLEDRALADGLNAALFDASQTKLELADGSSDVVRFTYSDGKSVRVEKAFRFTGGTYAIGIELHVWANGQEAAPSLVWGPGIDNPSPAELKKRITSTVGAAVYTGGKVVRMDEKKYKPEASTWNFVDWAAYEDNYFAALFVPPPQKGQATFEPEAATQGQTPVYFLSVSRPETAFIGPKDFDALKAFGHDAKKAINFGAFGSIAEILLIAVKYFYKLIPNWGVAIILLTLVIKIIFFPLTYSSTKSMAKMAELQPKIKALRAKYKKAKTDIEQRRQMNEEMMKLYKEHGVNPAGGCLPLLIQLPIFWGVFRMLVASVEFRHAPFCLWIKDLSVSDPSHVLPILMGVTQYITQKMTPTTADPAQAKMMLIMPVIMTVFFMNFQSGLILYWLTTNVLQIAQQALINRMMARQKGKENGKRK
ncbi:MAG TPA: membrane protein insertase YidC [Terriglobales bacterium]|nr:membrane protein insertase YidC [Terriglobales bacterium]